jgi:predicted dehydrogenase
MPAEKYKIATFDSAQKLMDSGLVDAVILSVPHYFHPPLASAAFRCGIHVMSEKPLAVTTKAAETVIAEHKKYPKLMFGVMFQKRTSSLHKKVHEILAGGELGEIKRVNWIVTNWFRSQAYYDSGGWRATWAGEGGGVLLNQCPHNLDLFQWFVGLPSKVEAHLGIGKYHHIEVEDEVTAYLEYPNGATGVFVTTTGEAPGTDRLEVVGDRGRLVADGSARIDIIKTDYPVAEFCHSTRDSFPWLPTAHVTVEVETPREDHKVVTAAFLKAIRSGKASDLIARGEEGIRGVELANAMIMSGITGKPVTLPIDGAAYERMLQKLIKTSKFKKTVAKDVHVDMGASFKSTSK